MSIKSSGNIRGFYRRVYRLRIGISDQGDRSHGIQTDSFVEAAHSIALEIDRDVLIADCPDVTNDAAANLGLEGTRQFVGANLDPRQRGRGTGAGELVMPHAADSKTERAECVFGALDRA